MEGGYSFINSVVSYPVMQFKNKNQFKSIFIDFIHDRYDFELFNIYFIRKQLPEEMKDVIIDYLNNINGHYGYSNKFLGIKMAFLKILTLRYPKNG